MSTAPTATALIADDEPLPRLRLADALAAAWPQLRIVAELGNGADAWDAWLEHEPQVCFLDIRMPGLTGIEVAQRIRGRAQVVFVAMPGDHALAAFDAAAVDYLVKPVDAGKLAELVAQLQARLEVSGPAAGEWQPLLDRLAGQVRKPAPLAYWLAWPMTDANAGCRRRGPRASWYSSAWRAARRRPRPAHRPPSARSRSSR